MRWQRSREKAISAIATEGAQLFKLSGNGCPGKGARWIASTSGNTRAGGGCAMLALVLPATRSVRDVMMYAGRSEAADGVGAAAKAYARARVEALRSPSPSGSPPLAGRASDDGAIASSGASPAAMPTKAPPTRATATRFEGIVAPKRAAEKSTTQVESSASDSATSLAIEVGDMPPDEKAAHASASPKPPPATDVAAAMVAASKYDRACPTLDRKPRGALGPSTGASPEGTSAASLPNA
jgi:hypothetical protein